MKVVRGINAYSVSCCVYMASVVVALLSFDGARMLA